MFLNVEGESIFLIYCFVVTIFVSCFGERRFYHRPLAFRRGADSVRVKMSLASACVASIYNIVVRVGADCPDIFIEPESFLGSNKVTLASEESIQILCRKQKDVLQYLQGALLGKRDTMHLLCIFSNKCAAFVLGCAYRSACKLNGIFRTGDVVSP